MSRNVGPRLRTIRALGIELPGLSRKRLDDNPAPPGQHGAKRRKQPSQYGLKLREKQKLRFHYGVTERQLRSVATQAFQTKGSTAAAIVQLMERRIDNIIFRAGFAGTIPGARQLVTHGHVQLNGKRMDIASARLRRGDKITVSSASAHIVRQQQSHGEGLAKPEWLNVDNDALTAELSMMPDENAVPFPIAMQLVVEFYS